MDVYNTGDGGLNWPAIDSISVTLTDLDFATPSQGYACGDSGAVYSVTSAGADNLNSGLASGLNGISSPSVDNVWICGGANIVYYNGTTFDFQSGPAGTYNSIFFIDNNEGWVVGDSGLIGHTINGGTTWTSQSNPSSNALYDVFFLDKDVGWAVGYNGTILHTTNGGDTWTIEGAGLTTVRLRGVHFTSPTNGYVVGNYKTLLKYGNTQPPAPNPSVDKRNIYFGEVAIGSHKDEVLTLSNTGTADLIVGQVALANPVELPFSIEEDNCTGETLVPAGTCTMTTRFSPTTDNEYSDTFDIPTNATPSTLTISLHSGIKPFPWPMFIPASTTKE